MDVVLKELYLSVDKTVLERKHPVVSYSIPTEDGADLQLGIVIIPG